MAGRQIATELTPAERQALKGRAHTLDPVVLIGAGGLTPAVLAEIGRALDAHELIKIRVAGADRAGRDSLLAEVCGTLGAAPVQHIGKVIVIFRERVEVAAPPTAPTPAKKKSARKRSARPSGAKTRLSSQRPSTPRRGKLRPR